MSKETTISFPTFEAKENGRALSVCPVGYIATEPITLLSTACSACCNIKSPDVTADRRITADRRRTEQNLTLWRRNYFFFNFNTSCI